MDGSARSGPGGVGNGMDKAQKFDDEKRRIIESCFKKEETDGSLAESYITHIRVIEDAAYPSSPPPPNANPDVKKPRLIIVSVRKSGRVRMHKARENANGSFSIGKSWSLDELTSLESFTSTAPGSAEEEQRRKWAGGVGFIATIGKPYYWQANSPKEKQFFVGSLVKIYTKYTGGRTPELIGFDTRERDQLTAASAAGRPPPSSAIPSGQSGPPFGRPPQNRPPPRGDNERSRDPPPLRAPPSRDGQRPQGLPPGIAPPFPRQGSANLDPQASRSQERSRREDSPGANSFNSAATSQAPLLRRLADNNRSEESFARSDDSSSLPPRSRNGINGMQNAPGRFPDRSRTPESQRGTPPPDSNVPSVPLVPNMPHIPPQHARGRSRDVSALPAPLAIGVPPERRRPPMPTNNDPNRPPGSSNGIDGNFPPPLGSPGMRRDGIAPPSRSSDRVAAERLSKPLSNDGLNSRPSFDRSVSNELVSPRDVSPGLSRTEGHRSTSSTSVPTLSNTNSSITPSSNSFKQADGPGGSGSLAKASTTSSLSTVQNADTSSPITSPVEAIEAVDDTRPDINPMIKTKSKGEIASTFLKAAKAANAFKPRAGGAAERLREAQARVEEPGGPDGITSVVPAPSLIRKTSAEVPAPVAPPASSATIEPVVKEANIETPVAHRKNDSIPQVKITVPGSNRPTSIEGPKEITNNTKPPERSKAREARRPKPVTEIMQKELGFLGVDPTVLGGRGTDLLSAWDDFGFSGDGVHTKNIGQMTEEIERELNKAQAGSWLSRFDEEDERVEAIRTGLDKCMDECDELDGLLTLYLVELGTLNEDIAYIEAQSQGLQVQAANQKLLQVELKSLLDTISISSSQLGSLREASLESIRGQEQIESSLVMLFKAMVTIDPSLSASAPRPSEDGSRSDKATGYGNSEVGSMRVLQEKKDVYMTECALFLRRLKPFLQVKFAAAIDETRKALEGEKGSKLTRTPGKAKIDSRNHDLSRNALWRYGPLMLFSREVDRLEWEELMKAYEGAAKPLYQNEFREAVFAWKRIARKAAGDEHEVLFTSQIEKQDQGLATTARKLTVKRSQTLAKSLRSPGDTSTKADKASDGRLPPNEVFAGVLDEMVPIVSMEQNFFVDFFHVSSLEQHDFPDAVAAAAPETRIGLDLKRIRVMDPDREIGKQVAQSMEEIFSFFASDLQVLVEWSLSSDPLQGVGVLVAIERKLLDLEESSQEYLTRTLQKAHQRLIGLFNKFIDEQVRAIEETKVKINKRKGVIAFMRIFPAFSMTLEMMLTTADGLEIRETMNQAYVRIIKTMFESLKVIARENPSAQAGGGDPEDKEALNYQILLIENMNHYLEEVETRSNPVLEDWKDNAGREMDEHMTLYLGAVIRRPLGKLLDFLESTESLMTSRRPGDSFSRISTMPSHSKSTFKRILSGYDAKEIRRGIETLRKRIEKHFGDADDPGLSRGLVGKVQTECEKYYEKVEDRILTISRDVYDGDIVIEWTHADVTGAFRK